MSLPVTVNGVDLNEYLKVTDLRRGIGPTRSNSLQKLGMTHGEHYLGYSKGAKIYEMDFVLRYDLISKRRALAGILDVTEPVQVIFGDEPDKYVMAIPDGDIDVAEKNFLGFGTIKWVIPSGYGESVSESPFTATPNADGILTMAVVNNGTETAEMSFEATMTDDNGYLGVVGPLGAMEFGNVAEIDGYMDMAETVYNDQMVPSDASKWTVNGGYIAWLNSNAGLPNKVQGSFSWTGETVKATNFGTAYNDNRWYGPTIAKAIPAKTSDGKRDGNFVHRFWLNHKSKKNARCVGRQEVNLSDGADPIATFVIYDDSSNSVRTCLEFTLFGIKQARIVADKDFQEFYGTVEIMKIGNEITFKVYNIDTKKTITKTYYDDRLGAAKITHKTYWCSRFMNLPICDMSLNYSFFQWIGSQEFVDVPNRYSSSDVLSYDGSTGKFYVNDTLAMNDIIVGSTDLKIPPGNWTVEFYYSDFGKTPPNIVGTLRERWL